MQLSVTRRTPVLRLVHASSPASYTVYSILRLHDERLHTVRVLVHAYMNTPDEGHQCMQVLLPLPQTRLSPDVDGRRACTSASNAGNSHFVCDAHSHGQCRSAAHHLLWNPEQILAGARPRKLFPQRRGHALWSATMHTGNVQSVLGCRREKKNGSDITPDPGGLNRTASRAHTADGAQRAQCCPRPNKATGTHSHRTD